jgi:hypothetical protein
LDLGRGQDRDISGGGRRWQEMTVKHEGAYTFEGHEEHGED